MSIKKTATMSVADKEWSKIRVTLTALLLSFFIVCCDEPSAEEVAKAEAMSVVQMCYDKLLAGDYDTFVTFRNGSENLPESYRQQMKEVYQMYMAEEQRVHHGIRQATATRAEMDSTQQVMHVFVLLTYGNDGQEEIVVPVVSTVDGQWRLK